jgi:hypothetical protein
MSLVATGLGGEADFVGLLFPCSVPLPLEKSCRKDVFLEGPLSRGPSTEESCLSLRMRVRQTTQRRGRQRCVTATWMVFTKHFRHTTCNNNQPANCLLHYVIYHTTWNPHN